MKWTKNLIAALSLATLATGFSLAAECGKKEDGKTAAGVPASYPLDKCVVSDEKLGEMGKAVKVTHEGTDIYFCCKSCLKDFKKDPGKYAQMVKDAAKK